VPVRNAAPWFAAGLLVAWPSAPARAETPDSDPKAVQVADQVMKALGGTTYDKVALSFQNVGETPGDHYWIYVNRANHRIEKWDFVRQGDRPPPETWTWEGWEQHSAMWFPTAHRSGEMTLYTHAVATMPQAPAKAFSTP